MDWKYGYLDSRTMMGITPEAQNVTSFHFYTNSPTEIIILKYED